MTVLTPANAFPGMPFPQHYATVNNARSFAGGTDKISATAIAGTVLSYSFWLYTASPGGVVVALNNGDSNLAGSEIVFSSSLTPILSINGTGTSVTSSVSVPASTWTNMVVTINSGVKNEIFVGGASGGSNAAAYVSATGGSAKLLWGADVNAHNMTCVIGETAFWNVVLSSSEISALASGSRASTIRPASLVGYWPLGISPPEPDFIGHNNGTVTGTTIVSGPPSLLPTLVILPSATQSYLYPGAVLPNPNPPPPSVLSIANAFPNLAFPQHKASQSAVQSFLYPGAVQPIAAPAFLAAWARGANRPILGVGHV